MGNHLCHNLLDQLQAFECYHILFSNFLLVDQNKKVFTINHNIMVFYLYFGRKFHVRLVVSVLFSNHKTNIIFSP